MIKVKEKLYPGNSTGLDAFSVDARNHHVAVTRWTGPSRDMFQCLVWRMRQYLSLIRIMDASPVKKVREVFDGFEALLSYCVIKYWHMPFHLRHKAHFSYNRGALQTSFSARPSLLYIQLPARQIQNVFVQFTKCICPTYWMYLTKL